MRFQNPSNGYVEESSVPILWAFLFGCFYFAYKGIWSHAAIALVAAIFTSGLSWLIYPFFARGIVKSHYLRMGWTMLDDEVSPARRPASSDEHMKRPEAPAQLAVGLSKPRSQFARPSIVTTPSKSGSVGGEVLFWGALGLCGLIFLGALGQILNHGAADEKRSEKASSVLASKGLDTGPAPAGEATVVARKAILENFDKSDCPLVTSARRYGDGSIKAHCDNGEAFRVFTLSKFGLIAMRCSAVAELGVSGC